MFLSGKLVGSGYFMTYIVLSLVATFEGFATFVIYYIEVRNF